MSNIPGELKYTRSHEWVRELADGNVEIGISDHAQHALGDLVYVDLPEVGRELNTGEACAVVESVKAASDVYSPIAGAVIAINNRLTQSPELINHEPYAGGWMLRLRPATPIAGAALLSAADYAAFAAAEG
ncbi:MAG: glycine cleavage system protein GcvH [Steroidobacterales bacterium]